MFRQRLRSSNGCERCRARKIKCDEQRPACVRCQRWGVTCKWPMNASSSQGEAPPSRPVSTNNGLPTLTRNISNGYEPFESQTQLDCTINSLPILLRYINPVSQPYFGDISVICTLVLERVWVRHAVIAFGGMTLLNHQPSGLETVINSYTKACINLRSHLSSHIDPWESDIPVFIAAAYLGLVESSLPGSPLPMLFHYATAANILSHSAWIATTSSATSPVKILAEFGLFGIALGTLLVSKHDQFLSKVDWGKYAQILDPGHPHQTVYVYSPTMHGTHDTCILMIQIISFARETHPTDVGQHQAALWLSAIYERESEFHTQYHGLFGASTPYAVQITLVHYRVMRILLYKIQNHLISLSDPLIREEVDVACDVLRMINSSDPLQISGVWTILVLLCAAPEERIPFLEHELLGDRSAPKNLALDSWSCAAVSKLRLYRQQGNGGQDCVDLLLRRGILDIP